MLRLAVTLVVPVLVAFALVLGATRIIGSEPQQSTWTPWGNRVASSPQELAGWLAARGSSYGEWAHRHPAAAARLEGRAVAVGPAAAQVEPASATVLRDTRDRALVTASLVLVGLVSLVLVLAGVRRALAFGSTFPRAPGAIGIGGGRRNAVVPLGRPGGSVEHSIRQVRLFYREHRDEILWLGVGSGCAVLASLAITL